MAEQTPNYCPYHPFAGATLPKVNPQFGKNICPSCGEFLFWTAPTLKSGKYKPECSNCKCAKAVKLTRQITTSGITQAFWYCYSCERFAIAGQFASHEHCYEVFAYLAYRYPNRAWPKSIDELPLLSDRSNVTPCVICGAPGEFNHWMPQAHRNHPDVTNDWPAWRQFGEYLCRKHHMIWHERQAPLGGLANVSGAK